MALDQLLHGINIEQAFKAIDYLAVVPTATVLGYLAIETVSLFKEPKDICEEPIDFSYFKSCYVNKSPSNKKRKK